MLQSYYIKAKNNYHCRRQQKPHDINKCQGNREGFSLLWLLCCRSNAQHDNCVCVCWMLDFNNRTLGYGLNILSNSSNLAFCMSVSTLELSDRLQIVNHTHQT